MEDYIGEFLLKSFVEFKDYRLKSFEKDLMELSLISTTK